MWWRLNYGFFFGSTQVVVGLIEELVARRGLVKAISNRDAASLEPLLAFLCK